MVGMIFDSIENDFDGFVVIRAIVNYITDFGQYLFFWVSEGDFDGFCMFGI